MGLEWRIVLGGKSAMANAILGSQGSKSEMAFGAVTQCCQRVETVVRSRMAAVVDTPRFLDTGRPERDTSFEVRKCMEFCSPGPHVYRWVIRLCCFTEDEKDVARSMKEILSLKAENYMIPLFTCKENPAEKDPEKFIREGNCALKEQASPSLQTTGLHSRKLVAVDTPSFFDTGPPERETSAEMSKRVEFCSPGPPVFRELILPARFTQDVARSIKEIYSLEAKNYMIPLFTRKENLEGKDPEKFIREGNSALNEQASLFGNRNSAFNNKAEGGEREAQVDQLMTVIGQLVERNKDAPCSTEEMMQSDRETVTTNHRRLCSLF